MAENKPERRKSPLYDKKDNERAPSSGSPGKGPDAGKMAEPRGKGSDGARSKESGAPKAEHAGHMREPDGKNNERAPEADGAGGMHEVHARHHEERAAMHKAHEAERRDMHGNHREEHRKMAARHEKAHKDLADKHMEELNAASGPTDGLKAGGEADMGGQTAAAGGEPTVPATEAA